ncbi:hypothetical protein KQQSB11_150143 [Klebsiella quasipneumoniae subsp. quasipneumoniae]|nr:hypothetical protein KQQSB11_150143 [Klebsiella quasipneumoniae subsp. quasipneumoniae]
MSLTVCDIARSTVLFCRHCPTFDAGNACQHSMIPFISLFFYWGVVFYYWGGSSIEPLLARIPI